MNHENCCMAQRKLGKMFITQRRCLAHISNEQLPRKEKQILHVSILQLKSAKMCAVVAIYS